MDLSIVIPLIDEAESLPELSAWIEKVMAEHQYSYEVIFVDDIKDIVKKEMTKSRLKKAWSLHFPFFDYEEYANKVNEIFEEAMREEVSKRDLQKYILDRLTNI